MLTLGQCKVSPRTPESPRHASRERPRYGSEQGCWKQPVLLSNASRCLVMLKTVLLFGTENPPVLPLTSPVILTPRAPPCCGWTSAHCGQRGARSHSDSVALKKLINP